jgi:high-affinity Fe2+/Pb2+ permease
MRDAKEMVAFVLVGTIAAFVISTLVVIFVLALNGTGLPDVWTSLFGLVIAIMSALGGWMVGKNSTTNGKTEGP